MSWWWWADEFWRLSVPLVILYLGFVVRWLLLRVRGLQDLAERTERYDCVCATFAKFPHPGLYAFRDPKCMAFYERRPGGAERCPVHPDREPLPHPPVAQ